MSEAVEKPIHKRSVEAVATAVKTRKPSFLMRVPYHTKSSTRRVSQGRGRFGKKGASSGGEEREANGGFELLVRIPPTTFAMTPETETKAKRPETCALVKAHWEMAKTWSLWGREWRVEEVQGGEEWMSRPWVPKVKSSKGYEDARAR